MCAAITPCLTRLERQDDTDAPTIEERERYCSATLFHVCELAGSFGVTMPRGPHLLVLRRDEFVFAGEIGFASNKRSTWVALAFQPRDLAPLIREIALGEDRDAAAISVPVDVPSVNGDGWDDTDLPPETNAAKLLTAMDRLAVEADTSGDFSELVRGARYPALYRWAEMGSLILEGKTVAARALARVWRADAADPRGQEEYDAVKRWLDANGATRRD